MTKALIDGDILLYRVGFTTEDIDDSNIVASRMDWLINETILGNLPGVTEFVIYLSGDKNFRKDIYPDYKKSRVDKVKPRHYEWLKQYLLEYYNTKIVEPLEADDLLSINQSKDTVIVSIDKDLFTIPGHHYNFVENIHSYIDENTAFYWYCVQLLTGDRTDDIPGVPMILKENKISEKKCFGNHTARQILLPLTNESSKEELLNKVISIYKQVYGTDHELYYSRNAKLLKLLQTENGYLDNYN